MQPALLHHTIPLLDGFPRSLAGRSVSFDLPRNLKLRMRHPEKIKVSDWAQQYRIVSDGAHEGPWRHEYAPHTVKIMDTFGQPWVREVWFCGVEQSGKTNTMINCIGWCIDCDPGGIFYLMPTEDTASKITSGKLKPTIEKSPRLSRYLSARQDDTTMARIKLSHGVTIWPAHANSASSMATWTAKHCFGDEVDKYPPTTGKEADPITLIKKRNRNYKGRYKRFFASTPAGLFIHRGVQNCHQVWEFRVKCQHCDEYIRMDAEHLVFKPPQSPLNVRGEASEAQQGGYPTPEEVERTGCHYSCNECGTEWDEQNRDYAIRMGHWFCVAGADISRPHKVGFHHRAWECLDITLAEIGAAWLRAQNGSLSEKIAWANGYEAVDYVEELGEAPELASLIERVETYAPVVPLQAGLLTAGVDVQQDRIEIEVVAWGVGAQSWGMEYNVLYGDTRLPDVWNQLDGYLLREWQHESGETIRITRCFVDGGYITNHVARFCAPRRARGIYMIKGSSNERAGEVQGPVNQRHGAVTCQVYNLGVNKLKTQMFAWFGISEPGAGYCHIPDTYPGKWFEMLMAEHCVEKKLGNDSINIWVMKKSGLRNESIDLRVYALAALMSMRVDIKGLVAGFKARAEERDKPKPQYKPKRGYVGKWR